MKILLVNVTEKITVSGQKIFQDVFDKVCGNSHELVMRNVTRGMTRLPDAIYNYVRLHNTRSLCERVIEANNEGFDAILTN